MVEGGKKSRKGMGGERVGELVGVLKSTEIH